MEPEDLASEQVEDVMTFVMRSGTSQSTLGNDIKKPKVLEVNQIWGELLLDSKHYAKKGRPITIGASTGARWNFLGIKLGWVRSPFDRILPMTPPVWSDVTTEWRNDFYTPEDTLPDGGDYSLFVWEDDGYVAKVAANWDGFADVGDKRHTFEELVAAGLATKTATGYTIPIADGTRLVIDIGGVTYFAHQVYPGAKVLAKMAENVDYPMIGIFLFFSFLGAMFGTLMYFAPPRAENEMVDIPDRFVELLLERPEPQPKEKKRPDKNPDAGEGAKAKKEEGKVGKKDAKMEKAKGNKKEIKKTEQDRQIAENAGVLGAMRDAGDLDGVFGTSGLSSSLTGGIGGLIGAKGTQIGSGGLGSRGSGLGGGGSAEGLGGLGTKGIGSGAGGFGSGGGNFGSKTSGNISAVGGDPIILGALDRSLIDEVIKRSMSQIRYCYQRELTKNPALSGKIIIKFTIAKDGSVSSANTKSTTLNNAAVEQCVVGRFYRMQFPEPKGGGVIVSYPFIFSPG
jgi:outer membrane biosynthesis protein TonB